MLIVSLVKTSILRVDKDETGGQQDPGAYRRNCQPSNDEVDGQATFPGTERRGVVSYVFRDLSIPYNPNLSQRLPARERHYLERSEEYFAIEEKIAILMGNRDRESMDRLETLRRKKRNLLSNALKAWQNN